jgi:hypothetical protein
MKDLDNPRMGEAVATRSIHENAISMTGAIHPDAKLRVYLPKGWQVPIVVDMQFKDPKHLKADGVRHIQITRNGLKEFMISAIHLANKHFAVDPKYSR